jgi:2-succinyl-5-enolpyruvyl-6-hydroxy-3-cyclohexene-1-carboxylate synthase
MSPANDTYMLLRAFVQELARCGMRAACTSPGSRCTPIVLSLANEPGLRCYSHIDERCSGFFALGLAKASGLPVAITCTSGTAAAELLPAVVEAHEARVPLIVLTGDRPAELREIGAGQTIDQIKLYGGAAKWFFEVGTHDCSEQRLRWIRTLACRSYWTALQGRPGVVHLNFALREPLLCDEPLGTDGTARADGSPYLICPPGRGAAEEQLSALREIVSSSKRGVLIAGRHELQDGFGQAAAEFCEAAGWPLLADPMSGARRGATAIAHYDALLRDEAFRAANTPDTVIRIGDLPTSKPLRGWLAQLPQTVQVGIDSQQAAQDPDSVLSSSFALAPVDALRALTGSLARSDSGYLERWQHSDRLAAQVIIGELGGGEISEPAIAAELGVLLPATATLFLASSMPVRDVETFWPARADPPRVLCNRGANGIDGIVSSALGTAAQGDGPVVLLIGDVALAHDIGGLLACSRCEVSLTIVLINNQGGGIFDFLPVASSPLALKDDVYSHHIATPTGLDFARAASLYGLAHEHVGDIRAFRGALERSLETSGSEILEVSTKRSENVDIHRRLWRAVARAIDLDDGHGSPAGHSDLLREDPM